jgi:hypothetical protein
MLGLRLTRGERPAALLRRALVAAASAGTGFLLLAALGHAMVQPSHPSGAVLRLVWCVVPLAAAVQLSVAVSRTRTGGRQSAALAVAGLGPGRMAWLEGAQVAVECLLGSAAALLAFVWWRDRFSGVGMPMPLGAVLTLLVTVPLAGAAACAAVCAAASRHRPESAAGSMTAGSAAEQAPSGLPWGVALTAAGLAVEVYASELTRPTAGSLVPLPGGLGELAPAVLAGWLLTAVGLVLAGPGLVHLTGRLLTVCRPGALRLLAGRTLQGDAPRIGPPLGVLCAVASAALAATRLYALGARPPGPLSALGAALVVGCTAATARTAASAARRSRKETVEALAPLGAPASLLRRASLLRTFAVLLVLAPVTSAVAGLASMPLR